MKYSLSDLSRVKKLGSGGNGDVYQVFQKSNPDELFAIKILKSKRINKTLYERFSAEIDFLRQEKGNTGILEILNYHLPKFENLKNEEAWYTMPIAESLVKCVRRNKLTPEQIIKIFEHYSATLTALNQKKIYHRDIKPDNLFVLKDIPVIGDFGLVRYPLKKQITDKRKLGPIFFIAPEMLNTPDEADYSKVDVYSLAKTLWVILTNQHYPIPGEHDLNYPAIHLRTYLNIPRIHILDILLNRSTKLDTSTRITVHEFNQELHAWLNPKPLSSKTMNLDDQLKELSFFMQPTIDQNQKNRMLEAEITRINQAIYQKVTPTLRAIEKGLPQKFDPGSNSTVIRANSIANNSGRIHIEGICNVLSIEKPVPLTLWLGWGCEVFQNETIALAVGYMIRVGLNGKEEVIWSMCRSAKAGSAELSNHTNDLSSEFINNISLGLKRFIEESKKVSF